MTRSAFAAVGSFVAAFVASSHHSLHMLLLSLGIGTSSLFFTPGLRRAMLALSLAMAAASAWWAWRRPHRGAPETFAVVAGLTASLALLGYSVVAHGF